MGWKAGTEREELGRIAAILLALADLTENAAALPGPVRWAVIWWLHQADTGAREFVAGYGLLVRQDAMTVTALHIGHEPADAHALSMSLRILALIVQQIASLPDYLSFAAVAGELAEICSGSQPIEGIENNVCHLFKERPDTS